MKTTRKALFLFNDPVDPCDVPSIAHIAITLHGEGWEVSITENIRKTLEYIGNNVPTVTCAEDIDFSTFDLIVFDENEYTLKVIPPIPEDVWCISRGFLHFAPTIIKLLCLDPSAMVNNEEKKTVQDSTLGFRNSIRSASIFATCYIIKQHEMSKKSDDLMETIELNLGWLRHSLYDFILDAADAGKSPYLTKWLDQVKKTPE